MKNKVYLGIAIRIVILFSLAMFSTYVSENLRGFFGDVKLSIPSTLGMDKNWDWGSRHYWYFYMMICLFLLSVANLVVYVVTVIKKEYDL